MTTIKPRRTFLGVPIIGDRHEGSSRVEQWSREDFETMMSAMMAEEFFLEFGWTQFTPYFNDGDPCEFEVQDPWVRTVGQEEINDSDQGTYDGEAKSEGALSLDYGNHGTLGGMVGAWNEPQVYQGERKELYDKAKAFASAINGGYFDNILLELFGDHCTVTVTKSKIDVEFYSHD